MAVNCGFGHILLRIIVLFGCSRQNIIWVTVCASLAAFGAVAQSQI